MSDSVKPVDCACGSTAEVEGIKHPHVVCTKRSCWREGPLGATVAASVLAWDKDQRALKHFDAVVEALGWAMERVPAGAPRGHEIKALLAGVR